MNEMYIILSITGCLEHWDLHVVAYIACTCLAVLFHVNVQIYCIALQTLGLCKVLYVQLPNSFCLSSRNRLLGPGWVIGMNGCPSPRRRPTFQPLERRCMMLETIY